MKMIISGKNIDVTPGLRSAVEAKLGKLERYFTADTEIYVTLSVEKDRQKIEVTIPMKGNIIRSEQTSSDMYVSIDLVEEIIERQLRRYKTKLIAQQQAAANGEIWKCTQSLNTPQGYGGGALRLELLQDVNGTSEATNVVDGEKLTFPYKLDITGAPGVSQGTLSVYEKINGEYQQLGSYPLTFEKAE